VSVLSPIKNGVFHRGVRRAVVARRVSGESLKKIAESVATDDAINGGCCVLRLLDARRHRNPDKFDLARRWRRK